MPKSNYFIVCSTEPDTDRPLFWDVGEMDWTPEEGKATRFDSRILTAPLPEGTGLVIECDPNGNYLKPLGVLDLPGVGVPFGV